MTAETHPHSAQLDAATPSPDRPSPKTLRLTFQIKLEDDITPLLEIGNVLDFPVSTKPTLLALLGDQVKTTFRVVAYELLLAEINHYVQEKLEATKQRQFDGPSTPELPEALAKFPVPPAASVAANCHDHAI